MSVPAQKLGITAALSLALMWPAGALAAPGGADADHDKVVDGLEKRIDPLSSRSKLRLIVSLDRRATAARVAQLEDAVGDMSVKRRFGVVDAVALTATKRQVRELARQGVVTRVSPDARVHAEAAAPFGTVGPLNASAQSSFGVSDARLDEPTLDGNADGDPNVYSSGDEVAAVLDTGIDKAHVDLDENKVIGFAQCLDPLPCVARTAYDDDGHGTHVSGTIAGDGDGPNLGSRGVAPGAALVGVKVLDSNGSGFTSDVVAGIEWVIANKDAYGIEALNISLGSDTPCTDGTSPDSLAANRAYAAGLVVAVAAGNSGPGTCTVGSPGDAKDAITVGAMADLGVDGFKQADFSSRGPTSDRRIKPDISAPGVGITSALAQPETVLGPHSQYTTMNGTSMATPFVTGVALLMQDANSTYSNDDVRDSIRSTAVDWGRGNPVTDAGSRGPDIDYGYGRLDGYAALRAAWEAAHPGDTSLTGPPPEPQHAIREGRLPGAGASMEYTVDVAATTFPVAATLVDLPSSCVSGGSDPDFDLTLVAPNGSVVDSATSDLRQDELGYSPTTTGVYRLRVVSFRDCGDFFVDVSGGSISMEGTSTGPGPAPGPSPGGPVTTTAPTTTLAPATVTTATMVEAAKTNARRAASALRKSGLRRLLRKRSFVLRGIAPSAGRLELAVRAASHGHQVTVAKLSQRVGAAGQPRLTVRLTPAGRKLFAHPLARRLTIRAAVVDAATGRRKLADYRLLVRR